VPLAAPDVGSAEAAGAAWGAGGGVAATGSRSIVRTWRVRPASVRTTAEGIAPVASFSIVARSPEYNPVPLIRTRSPTVNPARPALADRLIDATVGRT
jgi:hypothetical protein